MSLNALEKTVIILIDTFALFGFYTFIKSFYDTWKSQDNQEKRS